MDLRGTYDLTLASPVHVTCTKRGAWIPVGGLISDITLARVKRWMGALEGLFCVLPGDTQRNDNAVLMAIQTLRCASSLVDDNEWIQELVVDAHLYDAVNAGELGASARYLSQ